MDGALCYPEMNFICVFSLWCSVMPKQAIIVVHGVGVREAGVSTDLLSAALDDGAEPLALRPHSSDDFRLREGASYGQNGKFKTFPARLRRYKVPGTPPPQERIIVDFYWGDVTGTGGTTVNVIVGIFRLMLGLSHAVRENGWAVFEGNEGLMARLGAGAALLIHGPLFALNLMLALFALALGAGNHFGLWALVETSALPGFWLPFLVAIGLGVPGVILMRRAGAKATQTLAGLMLIGAAGALVLALQRAGQPQVLVVLCLVTFGAAYLLNARANAFLLRHLAKWLMIFAVFSALVALWPGLRGGLAQGADLFLGLPERLSETSPVQESGLILVALAVALWFAVILAAFALLVRRMGASSGNPSGTVDFQAEALGLMLVIWLLVTGVFWGAGLNLAQRMGIFWGAKTSDVERHLLFVPLAILCFVLILVAMGIQYAYVRVRSRQDGAVQNYIGGADFLAEDGRLLIGKSAILVLQVLVFMAGLYVVYVLVRLAGLHLPEAPPELLKRLPDLISYSLVGLATVGALVVGVMRSAVGMGVGIVIDVLAYINNYSWSSWKDVVPAGGEGAAMLRVERDAVEETATPTMDMLSGGPRAEWGYWLRRRIQDRLITLVDKLIADEAPDHILFVAHSQGTMIAIDTLELKGREWRQGVGDVSLITMGSPYLHLYAHYFGRSFAKPGARPVLQRVANGGALTSWVNVFRIDDFIGTHVCPNPLGVPGEDLWPREVAVPPNGHTNYWIDDSVAPILHDLAEF